MVLVVLSRSLGCSELVARGCVPPPPPANDRSSVTANTGPPRTKTCPRPFTCVNSSNPQAALGGGAAASPPSSWQGSDSGVRHHGDTEPQGLTLDAPLHRAWEGPQETPPIGSETCPRATVRGRRRQGLFFPSQRLRLPRAELTHPGGTEVGVGRDSPHH